MSYVPDKLKKAVRGNATGLCEYCLIGEAFSEKPHEIDHIIPVQHGGATQEDNLCLACLECNRAKGPNLCGYDEISAGVVRLFNPRTHRWSDHFRLEGASIAALSEIGRATTRILNLNDPDRVTDRQMLMDGGLYPR